MIYDHTTSICDQGGCHVSLENYFELLENLQIYQCDIFACSFHQCMTIPLDSHLIVSPSEHSVKGVEILGNRYVLIIQDFMVLVLDGVLILATSIMVLSVHKRCSPL